MAVRRLTIRPAEVPRFAEGEYHPDQATRYIELTSFIHRAYIFHLSTSSRRAWPK